jgi:hypothetical protein
MDEISERRLAENEVIFREANKNVQEFAESIGDSERILPFYCECSDETCRSKIKLSAKEFGQTHRNTQQFVVLPDHMNPDIEKKVNEAHGYFVVEKFMKAPGIQEID